MNRLPPGTLAWMSELIGNVIAPGRRAFVSPLVQEAIDAVLDETLPEGWRDNEGFVRGLSDRFRSKDFSTYEDPYFPHYYAAYYVPNNLYKIQLVLLELVRTGEISLGGEDLVVADIGCGVGTTAWALADFYEIFVNVVQLLGIEGVRLPKLRIRSMDCSAANIELFGRIREKLAYDQAWIRIDDPLQADLTAGDWCGLLAGGTSTVFLSNVLCELKSDRTRTEVVGRIFDRLPEKAHLVLVETARPAHVRALGSVRNSLSRRPDATSLGPCGRLGRHTGQCKHCWSFRREELLAPSTMRLFHHVERLKWSYAVFRKSGGTRRRRRSKATTALAKIDWSRQGSRVDVQVEVVSSRLGNTRFLRNYYLKVCDQSPVSQPTVLRLPGQFELPLHSFGDILDVHGAVVADRCHLGNVLEVDPSCTTVESVGEDCATPDLIHFPAVTEKNLLFFLRRFFGFRSFTEGQFQLLQRVLQGEPVLGILATGGGKSLAYQLPAILKPGVTIVVSPLKSLMDDQVTGMKERCGLEFVDRIHSGMRLQERACVLDRFRKGWLKLLYVAPERMQEASFQREIQLLIARGTPVNYMAVDEAHCISEWGHDFRPAYSRLQEHRNRVASPSYTPPIVALTATASDKVQQDVLEQLGLNGDTDLVHRIVDRKEISIEVISLEWRAEESCHAIRCRDADGAWTEREFRGDQSRLLVLEHVLSDVLPMRFSEGDLSDKPGIVFTMYANPGTPSRAREGAEGVSGWLRSRGMDAVAWYSDLDDPVKAKRQTAFVSGRQNLLVATKGFGMGIDKPDVRFVVHMGFPGSLEEYFQQIGRAGRDREHSHSILLWEPPTTRCWEALCEEYRGGKRAIPACYVRKPSGRYGDAPCPFGRAVRCDYGRRIYFIESSFPTRSELRQVEQHLRATARQRGMHPWVYVSIGELGAALRMNQDAVELAIETLYTMRVIDRRSKSSLEVRVTRQAPLSSLAEATNSELVQEHLGFVGLVYGSEILGQAPGNKARTFRLDTYLSKLRKLVNRDVALDEVLQFFRLMKEFPDCTVRERRKGYELRLAETAPDADQIYARLAEWKDAQYQMLWNFVEFANLAPFDQPVDIPALRGCRRGRILAVFSTDGASLDDAVRCNYCDNCGFTNFWHSLANDITASSEEERLRRQLRSLFRTVSKEGDRGATGMPEWEGLISGTCDKQAENLAYVLAANWIEQRGEQDNPAAHLFIALTSGRQGRVHDHGASVEVVLRYASQEDASLLKCVQWLAGVARISHAEIAARICDIPGIPLMPTARMLRMADPMVGASVADSVCLIHLALVLQRTEVTMTSMRALFNEQPTRRTRGPTGEGQRRNGRSAIEGAEALQRR